MVVMCILLVMGVCSLFWDSKNHHCHHQIVQLGFVTTTGKTTFVSIKGSLRAKYLLGESCPRRC